MKNNKCKFHHLFKLKNVRLLLFLAMTCLLSISYFVMFQFVFNKQSSGRKTSNSEISLKNVKTITTKIDPLNYSVRRKNTLIPVSELSKKLKSNDKAEGILHFNYTSINSDQCDFNPIVGGINIIFLVKSFLNNHERRKTIRETWGKPGIYEKNSVRVVFLVGMNTRERTYPESENRNINDIIQADFYDSYFNNILKTSMAFDWITKHCSNVDYYTFVDDDYLVSISNVFRFLRSPLNYPSASVAPKPLVHGFNEDLWAGFVNNHNIPVRKKRNKFYITTDQYPYDFYPPFISGGMFILSNKSFHKLYNASLYVGKFKFDDVYLGMCAARANLIPTHNRNFVILRREAGGNYRDVIGCHNFGQPSEMRQIWRENRGVTSKNG